MRRHRRRLNAASVSILLKMLGEFSTRPPPNVGEHNFQPTVMFVTQAIAAAATSVRKMMDAFKHRNRCSILRRAAAVPFATEEESRSVDGEPNNLKTI